MFKTGYYKFNKSSFYIHYEYYTVIRQLIFKIFALWNYQN